MPTYRFTGVEPEDFPVPPIARRLHPGDVIETDEPIEHVRLELVAAKTKPPKDTASPAKE